MTEDVEQQDKIYKREVDRETLEIQSPLNIK